MGAIVLLSGCLSSGIIVSGVSRDGVKIGWADLDCPKYIQYQAKKIDFGGIDIPITTANGGQLVKIGRLEVDPQKMREVSERMEALDFKQQQDCEVLRTAERNDLVTEDMLNNFYKSNQDFHKFLIGLISQ
ncbi:MAG: hypothetical protein AAFY29_11450 [Pseudomonadota bacterium]